MTSPTIPASRADAVAPPLPGTFDAPGAQRDVVSGILLIAGALAGVVVMSLHPTAHGGLPPEDAVSLMRLNVFVHSLAIAATPIVFLGLLGLARRLGHSHLSIGALVAFGYGGAAVMGAAVASGFVVPGVIDHIKAAAGSKVPDAFMLYTHLWNQGFANVNVVAYSVGIVLWSAAILRGGHMSRAVAVAGIAIGAGVLLGFFGGHLQLDVHGFGVITFAQSAWLIWIGLLLCLRPRLRSA